MSAPTVEAREQRVRRLMPCPNCSAEATRWRGLYRFRPYRRWRGHAVLCCGHCRSSWLVPYP